MIGFDALQKNLDYVRSGYVQALIAQHTDRQAVDAVNAMADYVLFGNSLEKKDNFTQMDILTKYNCEYY